jgi:hypothetical protein
VQGNTRCSRQRESFEDIVELMKLIERLRAMLEEIKIKQFLRARRTEILKRLHVRL